MNDFVLHVKSTLDKQGKDLADTLGVSFVDLDDTVNVEEVLTGTSPALVWRFVTMDETPSDPLYSLMFVMGIKTTSDPSNYSLLAMISKVKDLFGKGTWMNIMDYSGVSVPTVVKGSMIFTESGVDQQVMDRESGARMLTVTAKCIRNI